jgi:hypothetical protein
MLNALLAHLSTYRKKHITDEDDESISIMGDAESIYKNARCGR